jgi:hypothetical protein
MDSVTETILDEEVPQGRLGLLLKHFAQLDDAREPWRVVYPLGRQLSHSSIDIFSKNLPSDCSIINVSREL